MHAEGLDAPQAALKKFGAVVAASPPPAAAGDFAYYLNDFFTVIKGVEQLHAPLLNAAEQAYIAKLKALSRPAQLLYARLANRKGPYFRTDRLAYPEIGALDAPVAELGRCGLLEICSTAPDVTRQQRLLACFTLPELRAALKAHCPPKSGRAALLDWLAAWKNFSAWAETLLNEYRIVGLPESDPWKFLRFLFFGELRENLADFVIRALGHVVTESFDTAMLKPLFSSRAAADDAYRMACLYQAFGEIRDARPATALLAWWQGHRIERHGLEAGQAWFDRLVERLGRRLEREHAADAALELYATSPVAPARERLARLLIKAKRAGEAMEVLRSMLAAPGHSQEAYIARQLLARLAKKTRRSEGRQFQLLSRVITLHYVPRAGFSNAATTVEAAVLEYYRAQGWHGVHSENWLWNASFGLLLWDIIYDPALPVFHSPVQFAPLDLYSPEFYRRRQQAIESRLGLLQQPEQAFEIITRNYAAKQGLANPFVAWHEDLLGILAVMLRRVPPAGHAAVLRHMACNLRHHAHGFVDLFIWNDRDYRFIEIKGENDQLAAHQFEWLRFFLQAGINVSLEQVERPDRQAIGKRSANERTEL